MSKSFLRHIRVNSKGKLKARIELYLKETNENPVPFRWKYGMDLLVTKPLYINVIY